MAHGAALVHCARCWLWCDGPQGSVRMQPYEMCLRVLRKSFTGLLEHADKSQRQGELSYRGSSASRTIATEARE